MLPELTNAARCSCFGRIQAVTAKSPSPKFLESSMENVLRGTSRESVPPDSGDCFADRRIAQVRRAGELLRDPESGAGSTIESPSLSRDESGAAFAVSAAV